MAAKRPPEPLDAVVFNKLPRVDAEPGPGFPPVLCKPSPVPTAGSEHHLSYKGSYFSCPRTEGPLLHCLLHRPRSPPPGRLGAEQGADALVWDLLMARDKWPGHQGHPFPMKKPVAVPKPVYAAPLCFTPLGSQGGDSTLQRAPGAASPHGEPSRRGPHPEPSLLPLPPASPVAFSPYYAAFEKYRGPSASHDLTKVPELPGRIQDPWPKLRAPAGSPVHREHPPACYPQPPYPHPPFPQPPYPQPPRAEQPPGSLSSYKALGFAASGEPAPFPSAYLKPQTPRSYFPSPLDGFVSRPAGPGALPSPKAAGLPRAAEPPLPTGFLHPSPSFAFSPMEAALFGVTEHHGAGRAVEPHGGRPAARPGSAFHPVRAPQKMPEGLTGTFPKGDAGYGMDVVAKSSPVTPQHHPGTGDACRVGDTCRVRDACRAGDTTQEPAGAACPQERLRDLKSGEMSGEMSPASPPMPVINNVFSLAPYREYLEGTEASADVPVPKEHTQGDTSPQNTAGTWDPGAVKVSVTPSEGEGADQKVPPEGPKAKAVSPEPPAKSHEGGEVALDLSLKKSLVTTGDTHPDTRQPQEDKEGPPGKVEEVGEDTKPPVPPQLVEAVSGDRSHFQSSAAFMSKKYKILRSWGPPRAPQPSPVPRSPPGSPPPSTSAPQGTCHRRLTLTDMLVPQAPPVLGEDGAPLPACCDAPARQGLGNPCFAALHAALCDVLACSVAGSSPELLQEWLRRTEPEEALAEMPRSPPKPKNGVRLPEPPKPPKGKEIWLAFQDVAVLLSKLLSQLETFMFTRKCPFPHVVRAGAIFIPIHVVKEKLFPKLPGASVDQVLQEHKVELRPTTLSEEKLLRDLELKSCTSRMLKLLALKQLPDIYPDLLNLLWHHSIRQQLGR
ncbi:uncharacterized protein C15orf39 homolog [Anas platyrhynchos]